ncbi:hypothetical protein LPJ72_006127, partial [Coemansia sp. Benny D160-2]
MYRFLFYENGEYIAARFLDDINRQRHADINFARGFMDASLLPPGIAANPPLPAQPTSGVQMQPTSIDASLLPQGIAANPPPPAQPTSGVQMQPTSIDDGA